MLKKLFNFKNFLILLVLEILFGIIMVLTNDGWTGLPNFIGIMILECIFFITYVIIKGVINFIRASKKSKFIYLKWFCGLTLLNTLVYFFAVTTLKKTEFDLFELIQQPIRAVFLILVFLCFNFDLSVFTTKNLD